jgi:hypothetical protein
MIRDSDIILVTKPSSLNGSLDDGVVVWIMASSRLLLGRSNHMNQMKSVLDQRLGR